MTACRHVHYTHYSGRLVEGPRLDGQCDWCGAHENQPCQLRRHDDLPPVLGHAIRDTTHDIHRRALCGNED